MKIWEGLDRLDSVAKAVKEGTYEAPAGITFVQLMPQLPEPTTSHEDLPILFFDELDTLTPKQSWALNLASSRMPKPKTDYDGLADLVKELKF